MAASQVIPAHGRWIIVNLPLHQINIYEQGWAVNQIVHFSVGREHHLTPLVNDGQILPKKRFRMHKSSLYPPPHGGAQMPYSLFFTESAAFHGGPVTVESHGCVHLKDADAKWLFDWVGVSVVHVRFIGPYSHKHVSVDSKPDWRMA
jgi:lipoprotein-anchoring transpeptidase ErfK/SrfK